MTIQEFIAAERLSLANDMTADAEMSQEILHRNDEEQEFWESCTPITLADFNARESMLNRLEKLYPSH